MERFFDRKRSDRARSLALLEALDRCDPDAWARLDELVEELSPEDPVRRAAEFLAAVAADPAGRRAKANPALAHAAEHARDVRGEFRRLVLEWARRSTLREPWKCLALLDACRALLERLLHGPRPVDSYPLARAILALALAYWAEMRRILGEDREAEIDLGRALRHAEAAWRDGERSEADEEMLREIHATILERIADQALARGDAAAAERRLDEAMALLAGCAIPGRRAETLYRRARLALSRGRYGEAARELERAVHELPEGLDLHLRLDLEHLRAFAEAGLGRFERAAFHLEEAEKWLAEWGHEVIEAQREHLLGHLVMLDPRERDPTDRILSAEAHWRESFRLSLRNGRLTAAAETLGALLAAWRRSPMIWHGRDAEAEALLVELRKAQSSWRPTSEPIDGPTESSD